MAGHVQLSLTTCQGTLRCYDNYSLSLLERLLTKQRNWKWRGMAGSGSFVRLQDKDRRFSL